MNRAVGRQDLSVDKFAACNLRAPSSQTVSAPGIAQCPVTYECRLLAIDVVMGGLDPRKLGHAYPGDDLFRPFYGEILAVGAVDDAARMLGPA